MVSPSELDHQALRILDYLERENAVRVTTEEVGNYVPVHKICDDLDIFVGYWTKIKNHMLKRGMHICYMPGKGHYIGGRGEEVTNYVYKYKIARGWVKHLHVVKEMIQASDQAAKEWIDRRFKDFQLEEEEVSYAERSE